MTAAAHKNPAAKRGFLFSAVLAGAVIVAACGGDATAPAGIHGTYSLVQVNAKPVPAVLYSENEYTFEVRDGTYLLRNDNTFSSAVSFFETYRGWNHLSTHSFEGTFTLAGDTATFVWPGKNETWRGMLVGRDLTVTHQGITYLFRK